MAKTENTKRETVKVPASWRDLAAEFTRKASDNIKVRHVIVAHLLHSGISGKAIADSLGINAPEVSRIKQMFDSLGKRTVAYKTIAGLTVDAVKGADAARFDGLVAIGNKLVWTKPKSTKSTKSNKSNKSNTPDKDDTVTAETYVAGTRAAKAADAEWVQRVWDETMVAASVRLPLLRKLVADLDAHLAREAAEQDGAAA